MFRIEPPAVTRLEVTMFSGDTLAFGPYELTRALFHRYMIMHYAILCFVLTLVDIRSGSPGELLNEQAYVVVLSVVPALLLLALVTVFLDLFAQRRGTLRLKASPFLLGTALVGVLLGDISEIWLFGHDALRWVRTAALVIFYYILAEAFGHLLMLVVMPRVLREYRARIPPVMEPFVEPLAQPRAEQAFDHAEIAGRKIKADALVRITAEGNYLRVQTQQERLYLPGPFGAAVDPLPDRLGVRVSRSDWVAALAVAAIRREGREMIVELKDGSSIRVANSRQKVVASVLDVPIERGKARLADQGESETSIHSG